MKIFFLSGRELGYPRNRLIFDLLSVNNQVRYVGRQTGKASIVKQSILGTIQAFPALLSRQYSLCFIGFFGQLLMVPLGLIRRQKFLLDAFVSAYDTLCLDRQVFSPGSVQGRLAHWLDQAACQSASHLIVDTHAQAAYFQEEFGVPAEKIDVLMVGCDDRLFTPMKSLPEKELVLFYGSFLPLHGPEIILEAARKVSETRPSVRFRLIGSEFWKSSNPNFARWKNLPNVEWCPAVPINQLPGEIQQATLCLGGHFGTSQKAGRVIAGKTFQCIAMGKATIVGENLANHELLEHGKDAWFCRMGDSDALAEAILRLVDDPSLCKTLGDNARQTYLAKASNPILQNELEQIVLRVMNN